MAPWRATVLLRAAQIPRRLATKIWASPATGARRSICKSAAGSATATPTSTTNEALPGNPRAKGAAAWHMSGALTRFDRLFEVFEVSKAGTLRRTNVTLGEVLQDFGVHARDVLSLGLQDERYNPPPAVLPRDGVVVVALGPFKALIHTEACLLFEAGRIDVSHIAPVLAKLMHANAEIPLAEDRTSAPCSDASDAGGLNVEAPPRTRARTDDDVCELGQKGIAHTRRRDDGAVAAGTAADSASMQAASSEGDRPARQRSGKALSGEKQAPPLVMSEAEATGLASKIGHYIGDAFGFRGGREDQEEIVEGTAEGYLQEHQMKVMFKEQSPMPFELAMLEAMLQERRFRAWEEALADYLKASCKWTKIYAGRDHDDRIYHGVVASYYRRAHVVRQLMEQRLQPAGTTSLFTPNRVEHYRVVPLKLALRQLELKLSQTRACLEELMHSDEDMLGLLLTETKELQQGEVLDPVRHSVVELLLENYHRQLALVEHDVAAMKQELESLQELAAITLDVSRNSMIEIDIRLAMLNLGVATSACVFGAIGMNVVNGMEDSHLAFFALVGGAAAASAAGLGGVMRHLRSVARAGSSQQGQLMALTTICDHVDDIEIVLRAELESHGGASKGAACYGFLDRDAMAQKLSRARGKKVSEAELDLIFAAFDTTGDGSIDAKEYDKLVTESSSSLRKRPVEGTR